MFRPEHCSEKVVGLTSYDNCGPCSALMLANAVAGSNVHPATLTEATRIRAAGLPGPTNPDGSPAKATSGPQLQRGLHNLYGLDTGLVETFPTVWSKLIPGTGAACFGFLRNFAQGTPAYRLRRWQYSYLGGHVVYVQREGSEDQVWWMDPLAPKGTYLGEWVTKAELATFMSVAADDTAVYASLPQGGTGDMAYAPVKRMHVALAAGSDYYWEPGGAIIGQLTSTARFEVAAFATNPNGTLAADWSLLYGLKADNVTRDIAAPARSGWVHSDRLSDPKEISLGGCTPAELAQAVAADRAKAKIVYV